SSTRRCWRARPASASGWRSRSAPAPRSCSRPTRCCSESRRSSWATRKASCSSREAALVRRPLPGHGPGLLVVPAPVPAGRVRLLFVYFRGRDRERRRQAVAHLKGRLLRGLFAALGACFVKLGQVLSTRPDLLEPEIIDELRQLQDRMPPFAFARARQI